MFSARILVIEDNEENLLMMRLMLERAKYEVLWADDGIKGLDIAGKEQPDIILLDLAMPKMSGWEVARKLKSNILTKEIPIIAVTALSLKKERLRAIEADCEMLIRKPFKMAKLMGEIERLTEW
jgi:CheY-like chemotaxis protein